MDAATGNAPGRIEQADDPGGATPIVATAGSYDGMADTPSLSLAAAVLAATVPARTSPASNILLRIVRSA